MEMVPEASYDMFDTILLKNIALELDFCLRSFK